MKPPSLSDLVRQELRDALLAERRLDAVWLGLRSGAPLAEEGRGAVARRRLAGQAPVLLARPPAAPARVTLDDAAEVVVLPVDEEKRLLALARPGQLDEEGVASLQARAVRLAACFDAWESRLLAGPEESV